MLLDIGQIKVSDRIRKDFGNLQELADDIKENGLINPPVVTPEYELIAGERRLRACKLLGYQQIEVRVMSVKDYGHQLRLEISENEKRKNFTFSEGIEWSKKLEQIEALQAKERMSLGGQGRQNLGNLRTDEVVASQTGFGSRENYRKAKFIAEHGDAEAIGRLDSGESSIHREYEELKRKLKRVEDDLEATTKQAESIMERDKKLMDKWDSEVQQGIEQRLSPERESLRSEIETEVEQKYREKIKLYESTNQKLFERSKKLQELEESPVWEAAGARNEVTRIMNEVYSLASKGFAEIESTYLEKLSPDMNTVPLLNHIAEQFIEMGERIQSWLNPKTNKEFVIEGEYRV